VTIGRVAMNDAALGCFIESGNQAANLFCVRFGRAANAFLQRAQTRSHTAILISALERLSGTFRCGFGIGHGLVTENLSSGDGRADRQNVKMSILNQVRGPDAILICEESFRNPEAEAGASKPKTSGSAIFEAFGNRS
jgi:hypothetical protein